MVIQMKDFIKRTWKYFVFIPIILVIVVGIILNLPKDTGRLELEITDIVLKVGESQVINYKTNIQDAECSFRLDDDSIAVIENQNIIGKNSGETKLFATAVYENNVIYKTVNVSVLPKESSENENDDGQNEGENNQNEEENGQGEVNEDVKISIYFQLEEINEIEIPVGSYKIVEIFSNYEFKIVAPNDITVEELFSIENSYKITANTYGNYEIVFKVGDFQRVLKVKAI